jgi:CRISPR-associated protein Cmr3
LSDAELEEKQIKLCSEFGVSDRQLKNLWVKLEEERNFQETKGDRHQELEKLLSIQDYRLSLKGILHQSLAEPFEKIAGWIGSSPEAFLTILLPTVATLAWGGTELMLMPSTGFRALPILYTGIVGQSGSAKSPTQKMITKALFQLQKEEEEDYENRLKSWNDQCQKAEKDGEPKPDKPTVREFYTVDVTREAVAMIQSQQPDRGFLCNHDELSGLFNGQNAYRGGKGGDKEALLSARDGSGLKVNRASGKRISTSGSYHSITGGTQPDTLKGMMGDFDDGSGQWARFLWCLLFQKPAPYIRSEEAGSTIDEMQSRLYSLYSLVQTYPAKTYTLSPEAEELYAAWFNQLDELRLKDERQAFQAIYSKAKGNTGELALILHLTNSAAARFRTPNDMVSGQTMKAAIALMKFYIGQVKLVHSLGDEQRGEITPLLAKIIELSKRKGEVSARDCQSGIASLRKEDVAKIRGYFRDLVEGEYGVLTGNGDRVRFQATADKSKSADKKSSAPSAVGTARDTAFTADSTADKLSAPSTLDTEPLLEEISETADDLLLSDKSGSFKEGDHVSPISLIAVGDEVTILDVTSPHKGQIGEVRELIARTTNETLYRVVRDYEGTPELNFDATFPLGGIRARSKSQYSWEPA